LNIIIVTSFSGHTLSYFVGDPTAPLQKSEHPESTYEYWESGLRGNRFYANIIPGDGPTDGFLFHDLMIPETYRTQIPRG